MQTAASLEYANWWNSSELVSAGYRHFCLTLLADSIFAVLVDLCFQWCPTDCWHLWFIYVCWHCGVHYYCYCYWPVVNLFTQSRSTAWMLQDIAVFIRLIVKTSSKLILLTRVAVFRTVSRSALVCSTDVVSISVLIQFKHLICVHCTSSCYACRTQCCFSLLSICPSNADIVSKWMDILSVFNYLAGVWASLPLKSSNGNS